METASVTTADVPPVEPAGFSPWQRLIAIFVRPTGAWGDLRTRSSLLFPLLLMALFQVGLAASLYERAVVPTQVAKMEESVESGKMPAEELDRIEAGMHSPVWTVVSAAGAGIVWVLLTLVVALGIWFAVGFVLGGKLTYRQSLNIAAWSSMVLIPGEIVRGILAWSRGTMEGIHLGLGALVPVGDPPTRLMAALASFLDVVGPFSIWCIVVTVIGAAAISGAPRRSVAWVISGLYVAFALFGAAMAALFIRGS